MNKSLKDQFYSIIIQISYHYIINEKLKTEYNELLDTFIHNSNRSHEHKQDPPRTSNNKKKSNFTFHRDNVRPIPRQVPLKHDEVIFVQKPKSIPPTSKRASASSQQPSKNSKDWDKYNYFEPQKNSKKILQKNTIQRLKPKRMLKKILKRLYKKLLIKLHPDRSTIENAEQFCKNLVRRYKECDYCYLFHLFKISFCSIQLSDNELEILNPFMLQELRRIHMTNGCLTTSIEKFRSNKS